MYAEYRWGFHNRKLKKKTYLELAEVKVDGGGALNGGENGKDGGGGAGRKFHDEVCFADWVALEAQGNNTLIVWPRGRFLCRVKFVPSLFAPRICASWFVVAHPLTAEDESRPWTVRLCVWLRVFWLRVYQVGELFPPTAEITMVPQ